MNAMRAVNYVILVVSAAVAVFGTLVIAGILVPKNFPEQFRVVIGVVILLYGVYHFVVSWYRQKER